MQDIEASKSTVRSASRELRKAAVRAQVSDDKTRSWRGGLSTGEEGPVYSLGNLNLTPTLWKTSERSELGSDMSK